MSKKILIVDDDTGVCRSLGILLRGEGYSVDEATDSAGAVGLIKKNIYDLCLFDYKMDGLSGVDLLGIVKGINPKCPVFIISGILNINQLRVDKTSYALADKIVIKPFDVEKLLKEIAAVIL